MARKVSKCECGRRKSQYLNECNRCRAEKARAHNAECEAVLATGKCPRCGSALKRNLSITGWWQCEQYGAVTHRARPQDPQCSYQFIIDKEVA